jgi:hypothetical protein
MSECIKLTVFFQEPFWVGVFEETNDVELKVSRVVFGAEPKDYEIYDFLLKNYSNIKFSEGFEIDDSDKIIKKINPKRLQRKAKKETHDKGIGTKSQMAIKLQQEKNKKERKTKSREQKELEKQRKFELKQQKKLKKHKGH